MSSGLLRNGLKVHGVRELEDDIHWSGFTGAELGPGLGPGSGPGLESDLKPGFRLRPGSSSELGFGSGKRD